MNNLAYALGMKRAFTFGFYVATVGEHDLGVVNESALRRTALADLFRKKLLEVGQLLRAG